MPNPIPFEVGFGETDITPTPPAEKPDAFRVFDRIGFRATVMRRGDEHVALLTGDFFSFEADLLAHVRRRLAHVAWLDPMHILSSVSHTGGVPILFPSYVHQPCAELRHFGRGEQYADLAADALLAAIGDLRPARVGVGRRAVEGVSYNRRSYDAAGRLVMSNFMFPFPRPELRYQPIDADVYVVRFDESGDEGRETGDSKGRPRGAITSFGCHALCNSDKQGHISADYPGVARRVIANAWGVPAGNVAFAPGAIGDVVPFQRSGRTYEIVGNAVGGAALCALEQTRSSTDVKLVVRQSRFKVPTFSRAAVEEAEAALAAVKNNSDGTERMNLHGARQHAGGGEIDYTLTSIRLGDAMIVHVPGEAFVATAAAVKQASPCATTIVLSGPTADVGYLCPATAHAEGGMEPQFTSVAPDAETVVRGRAIDLVRASE